MTSGEHRRDVPSGDIGSVSARTWTKRRRRRGLDNPNLIIEFVPGPTPYFWIGERYGDYYSSINADRLADWIDDLRRGSVVTVLEVRDHE